jgi:SSS family solute:Na+ symporter
VNSQAAIVTLFSGLVVAALRICAEIYQADLSGVFLSFATINFAHMAIFMFIFSVLVCVTVSLATNPPQYSAIKGLSLGTLTEEQRKISKENISVIDVVLSVMLIVVVVAVLFYFTG